MTSEAAFKEDADVRLRQSIRRDRRRNGSQRQAMYIELEHRVVEETPEGGRKERISAIRTISWRSDSAAAAPANGCKPSNGRTLHPVQSQPPHTRSAANSPHASAAGTAAALPSSVRPVDAQTRDSLATAQQQASPQPPLDAEFQAASSVTMGPPTPAASVEPSIVVEPPASEVTLGAAGAAVPIPELESMPASFPLLRTEGSQIGGSMAGRVTPHIPSWSTEDIGEQQTVQQQQQQAQSLMVHHHSHFHYHTYNYSNCVIHMHQPPETSSPDRAV